jgi:hypothetical protein
MRCAAPRSLRVRNLSPEEVSQGSAGSSAAELALVLVLELTRGDLAFSWYQGVEWRIVARLAQDDGVIDSQENRWGGSFTGDKPGPWPGAERAFPEI